jgi:hypothetical protein
MTIKESLTKTKMNAAVEIKIHRLNHAIQTVPPFFGKTNGEAIDYAISALKSLRKSLATKDTVENLSGVKIIYAPGGKTLEQKAKAEGWICEWKNIGINCPRPDFWRREKGASCAAFSPGALCWIDPKGRKIASFEWENEWK